MSYYNDAYVKRLNRYGNDYQSRIQGEREKVFQNYLLKSAFRVEFSYNDVDYIGALEPMKQDETKTLEYLLVPTSVNFDNGTILEIPDFNKNLQKWMVYYFEEEEAKGYNRYIMLKMSHTINWIDRDGNSNSAPAYFYGPENNLQGVAKSYKTQSRYLETITLYNFITPLNKNINRDDYFELVTGEGDNQVTTSYVVTGYDVNSTLGVEYVAADPSYIRDQSAAPEKKDTDSEDEFYWFGGND